MNSPELHINDLPSEMLGQIFSFVPHLKDRKPLSLVCRRWNDLAFNYYYLSQIRVQLAIGDDGMTRLNSISRCYRNVSLRILHTASVGDEEIGKALKGFEKLGPSLEKLKCFELSPNFLALKLLSKCPTVRKVELDFDSIGDIPDEHLPVLENLKELVVSGVKRMNIKRLAPNLRRLETACALDATLPMVIPQLPLKHLRVDSDTYIDVFQNCTKATKLTSVDLFHSPIVENDLEQICKFCPLLTKLRIYVAGLTLLRCLADLTHLKVLSLYDANNESFANRDVCLPSVETLEITTRAGFRFESSMQTMFPNVRHFKFDCFIVGWDLPAATGKVSDAFPHLKTLEFALDRTERRLDQLDGLFELRELIVHKSTHLSGNCLPPMNVQQLTLMHTELEVTDEMVKNLPNLQFVNLYGCARCTETAKLPSRCVVRRYRWNFDRFDLFGFGN